jgi:hypothetical protein
VRELAEPLNRGDTVDGAARERAELAKAEMDNGTPHIYAQALISMKSALDAMVETLVRHWRGLHVERIARHILDKAAESQPAAAASLPPEIVDAVERVVHEEADRLVPKAPRPAGRGVERYEKALRVIGAHAPDDRPLPADLDVALAELGALRDVLVHRAGRLDEKALQEAPRLRYEVGQLVRVSAEDYRTYSAAIRCYAYEVGFRGMRHWPEVSDENGPNLAQWRDYYRIGA